MDIKSQVEQKKQEPTPPPELKLSTLPVTGTFIIVGPRACGKTTLANNICQEVTQQARVKRTCVCFHAGLLPAITKNEYKVLLESRGNTVSILAEEKEVDATVANHLQKTASTAPSMRPTQPDIMRVIFEETKEQFWGNPRPCQLQLITVRQSLLQVDKRIRHACDWLFVSLAADDEDDDWDLTKQLSLLTQWFAPTTLVSQLQRLARSAQAAKRRFLCMDVHASTDTAWFVL